MSSVTSLSTHANRAPVALPLSSSIPFSRLVRVEWSKATDTRAARALLGLVALLSVVVTAVAGFVPKSFDQSFTGYLRASVTGPVVLLHVVAILLVTTEWSQRSIMTTFTQEPRRLRVLSAKFVVTLMMSVFSAVYVVLIAVCGLGLASASGRTLENDFSFGAVVGLLPYILLNALAGLALAVLLHGSAAAIASSFALPAVFAVFGTASKFVNEWIDTTAPWTWVFKNEWAGHVPQILFSIFIWVALPLAAGVVRTLRRDVG
jgi:ABC-2 type transport system permease protein